MFQNRQSSNPVIPVSILSLLLLLGFIALLMQTGCTPEADPIGSGDLIYEPPQYTQAKEDRNSGEVPNLAISSFNIQGFGKAKMSKPGVVSILVDVARRFDILAVQELRDKDQGVIPEFLSLINADGSQYAAAVGPRQGYIANGRKTTYFEQTVFIYDTTTTELITPAYAAFDRLDTMYRPPFVGHFRSVKVDPAEAFHFVLMNVHVAPRRTRIEFEALKAIIAGIYGNHPGEDDFILLGDLNDEPSGYQNYGWMNDQVSALPDEVKTNTKREDAYDNIVFDAVRTSEYQQKSGVLDLMSEYDLSFEDAKLVSDHLPVWALFSAFEAPSAAITRGDESVIR